ncbi:restriction endonuclease subunit S [Phaeovulum vinaykumarii]|uniref:Type I restriction enzyme, S subunit n=1 Tax=Phaeovulum vinaykumarii TaxID=407234 RepID=A0A1N7N074_9RHOB|nr:restriction endonuclease subunit S [Phaeovulum vinaykumarii]SIS91591.1 type I restriction enzyme, S subunit [Phaeovulum vinaykumarii]SOC17578.1 type I restriction enzyme S subunit [Phaeovulum vinaykumarii]
MREGWRDVHFEELVSDTQLGTTERGELDDEDNIPLLKMGNLTWGGFDLRTTEHIALRHIIGSNLILKPGDLLFNTRNSADLVGKSAVWQGQFRSAVFDNNINRIRLKPIADPAFYGTFLNTGVGKRRVQSLAVGSTSVAAIYWKDLKNLQVPLPPLPEQRKIAEILRTWDEALEKLTALRAAKERRLSALRAALLFGRLRLGGLGHKWVPTRLDTVTHELTKRNGGKGLGRDFVMGVTKAEGVVPMREQTIAGDISRYKRLPPRAFAYNPMRINVGSIAMNEREGEVLVSPDYVVFACNPDALDPDYLDHLRKTSWWGHYINSGGSGSVRQRTYYDDLAALKLPLPELDEQKAIAAVLNTARDDLAATEREIEALTRQKRGLMQKLLTGKWRVNSEKELA